jgi:hypothetical protein
MMAMGDTWSAVVYHGRDTKRTDVRNARLSSGATSIAGYECENKQQGAYVDIPFSRIKRIRLSRQFDPNLTPWETWSLEYLDLTLKTGAHVQVKPQSSRFMAWSVNGETDNGTISIPMRQVDAFYILQEGESFEPEQVSTKGAIMGIVVAGLLLVACVAIVLSLSSSSGQ